MTSRVVLKIGGSLLFEGTKLQLKRVREFARFVTNTPPISAIVVGGGNMARTYIQGARDLGASEAECDLFGIASSRMNGQLLIRAIGDAAFPRVVESVEDCARAAVTGKIVVAGGLQPGQSTTSVAAILAEFLHADRLIILTDVDAIYDQDPRKHPEAKRYPTITASELLQVLQKGAGAKQAAAGGYQIFDPVSAEIVERSHLPVQLVSGQDLSQVGKAIADPAADIGTKIVY